MNATITDTAMKLFDKDIFRIFQQNDIDSMIADINLVYPDTRIKNFYKEDLDSRLQYLNFIPKYLFDLDNPDGPILLNICNSFIALPEDKIGWHVDSEIANQITILFYPQIDVDCGGEFCTLAKTQIIRPGNIVVLPANETHCLKDYKSKLPRISLKWMFTVDEQYANSFRD